MNCKYCQRPKRRGSVMCGAPACLRQYRRQWHAANRKKHPDRYGTAFYRSRGRAPPPSKPKPERCLVPSNERLAALREWVLSLWYGATKAALLERFEEFYGDARPRTAAERRFYRDIERLCAGGQVVRVGARWVRAERALAVSAE